MGSKKEKKEKKERKEKKRRARSSSPSSGTDSDEEYKRRKADKLVRSRAWEQHMGRSAVGLGARVAAPVSPPLAESCRVVSASHCCSHLVQAKKVAQHLKKHKVTGTGYTNEDNPFGDTNLDDRFVWGKKITKELSSGRDVREMTAKAEMKRQAERLVSRRPACQPRSGVQRLLLGAWTWFQEAWEQRGW
jgi:hypothetical protein